MTRKGQNLISYYQSLGRSYKTKFVRKVASQCDISSNAVLKWVFGDCKPSRPEYIDILAKESGIPAENLFNRSLDEKHWVLYVWRPNMVSHGGWESTPSDRIRPWCHSVYHWEVPRVLSRSSRSKSQWIQTMPSESPSLPISSCVAVMQMQLRCYRY